MTIKGTTHRNFSDSPFFSPLKSLTGAGTIPTTRCAQIVNQYSLAFFDKTLKGQGEPLLQNVAHEFPEARLEVWSAQTNTNSNSAALLAATGGRR